MGRLTEKTIDIDDILKDKMGDKAKFVPDVLVSWLKRIVHQKEVNDFLWENREKQGVEWLDACVRYLDMTLEVNGRENLPIRLMADSIRLFLIILLVVSTV